MTTKKSTAARNIIHGMIRLSMFLDQNSRTKNSTDNVASGQLTLPFRLWASGHVLRTEANPEEWTIKTIEAAPDHRMRREDCMVTLINVAKEMRQVRGATLQSSYKFVSTGDVAPPEPEAEAQLVRTDVKPFAVTVHAIREFYPRKHGNEGTRLIMQDKTAYIVAEPFDTVWSMCAAAGMPLHLAKLEHTSESGEEAGHHE